jgi:hypothetical protein
MSTPFKMKGFSGFVNSPMKQDEKKKKKTTLTAAQKKAIYDQHEKEMAEYFKKSKAFTNDTTGTVTMPTLPKTLKQRGL